MDIHKGILVKEIDDNDNFIYPKSSSDLITHGDNEETTVEEELNRLREDTNINISNITSISNEIRDARLPSAGGSIKSSINERLNTDYSFLRQEISTLGGQLSGDLNRLTHLINTENRNTTLVVNNYKEISRARKSITDNEIKNTLNDRLNTDYSNLENKIYERNNEFDNKTRILKKYLTKKIREINDARYSLLDAEYKYSLAQRLNSDFRYLNEELTNARTNEITGQTYENLKRRLDDEYRLHSFTRTEVTNARTSTRYINANDHSLGYVVEDNLKDRLDNDYQILHDGIVSTNNTIVNLSNRVLPIADQVDAAIVANTSAWQNPDTLKGRLEHDFQYLNNLITNNTDTIRTTNTLIESLYLTKDTTYTIDHIFCPGMITTDKKRIACYIPTPPILNVINIGTIASNLESEAHIVVRAAYTGSANSTNNAFINDEGPNNSTIYFKAAVEAVVGSGNFSNVTLTFIPRKYGIEFRMDYASGFNVTVNNQPVVVTFTNLKLVLS